MPSAPSLPVLSAVARRYQPSPQAVARARELVEGTVLSQAAIGRETGIGRLTLQALIRAEGWRRPDGARRWPRALGPELLGRMRALAEGTTDTQRAIGRALGVSPDLVGRCIRRHGWERPVPEPASGSVVAARWPRRSGRPFRIDAVVQLRDLYTGTTLPLGAISARTGVSVPSVSQIGRRRGWVRPPGAPRCNREVSPHRAGLARRLADARDRIGALAARWEAAWRAAAPDPAVAAAIGRARALAARAASRPA